MNNSGIDMSLEDYIQNKKKNVKRLPQQFKNFPNQPLPKLDARNRIISKKRTQIKDAREKLAELAKQRDARQKLEQLRAKKVTNLQSMRGPFVTQSRKGKPAILSRTIMQRDAVFTDPTRQVRTHLNTLNTKIQVGRQIGLRNKAPISRSTGARSNTSHYMPPLKPIVRTVENDVMIVDEDDPMTGYVPPKVSLGRKTSLNLKIIAHNTDVKERNPGLIKSVSRAHEREKERETSPRLTSILKKRPMAALKKIEKPESKPNSEYRIIVSNLHTTVTGSDIQELFGDVGGLLESRLVRPGTAEVIYKTLEDAQKAVDLYHNRQLDGQPMNCLLVTPRSTTPAPLRTSNKTLPPSTNSNVEPDLNTFYKVLFSNF